MRSDPLFTRRKGATGDSTLVFRPDPRPRDKDEESNDQSKNREGQSQRIQGEEGNAASEVADLHRSGICGGQQVHAKSHNQDRGQVDPPVSHGWFDGWIHLNPIAPGKSVPLVRRPCDSSAEIDPLPTRSKIVSVPSQEEDARPKYKKEASPGTDGERGVTYSPAEGVNEDECPDRCDDDEVGHPCRGRIFDLRHGSSSQIDVLYRIRPPGLLEATVPERERRWIERSKAFVEEKEKAGEWSESTVVSYRGTLRVLQRHLTIPGSPPPSSQEIGPGHIRRLRESGLAPNTLALNLNVLRGFLRREGNPVAGDERLWQVKRNDLGKRRWLSRPQAIALWNAATPEERVLVGLEMLAGCRRIEVLRLRVRDICFALDNATANVLGKGHKWRTVSLPPLVWAALRTQTAEMNPEEQVWPLGETSADRALYAAGKRSGAFPIRRNGTPDLSHHDLRRTFIRLVLETGKVGIWDVAQMVGHKSADLTIHYAGLDRERATEAARALEAGLGLAPRK